MIHLLTGEYPPDPGGVGDYTRQIANALAAQGQQVHVWTGGQDPATREGGVHVHRIAGRFGPDGLARLGHAMDSMPGQRRLIVQWAPHSFGMRGLNMAFPAWLWRRSATWRIEAIAHEAFVAFGEGGWRQNAAGVVQRVMAVQLLRAASRVWVAIPAWESRLRPWALGKKMPFEWLPVPSNIPPLENLGAIVEVRRKFAAFRHPLIGHFGTYRRDVESLLVPALLELQRSRAVILLIGRGSEEARARLVKQHSTLSHRVFATGELDAHDIAAHLSACDLLLQPYPDGISSRRGSAMAALSLGVPLVTNLGHLSEALWSETGAIARARSSSSAHLAAAALELVEDHARRMRISEAARNLYHDEFHIRRTVSALLKNQAAESLTRARATA